MKRNVTTAALATALCSAVTAGPLDLDAIKARGTLRVIVAADEAPETFALQAGGDSGFERELLEGFARLRGLKEDPALRGTLEEYLGNIRRGPSWSWAITATATPTSTPRRSSATRRRC
jgi:ABC-type amino acid transport substrate-binding protein